MKKILVICGPTATGKTSLAIHLSKVVGGEIVSADSRQVYKRMDVGTGKDLPGNAKWQTKNGKLRDGIGYYEIDGVKLWGYDLVEPQEEFSVAHYLKIAQKIISDIWRRGKLPILVGGTGLYLKAVTDGIPTAGVPRDSFLRTRLNKKDADELFEMLKVIDPVKANKMNFSDRKNPRRLIRAIEVANQTVGGKYQVPDDRENMEVLFIGLMMPKEMLFKRIEERVNSRLKQGFESEVASLVMNGVSWGDQSMQSLGYRQWGEYISGKMSKEEAISLWMQEEKKYMKRQMTWFKKDGRVKWFSVSKKGWQSEVEKKVQGWHNKKS